MAGRDTFLREPLLEGRRLEVEAAHLEEPEERLRRDCHANVKNTIAAESLWELSDSIWAGPALAGTHLS